MSEQQRTGGREAPASIPHWLSPDGEVIELTDGDGAYVYDADGTEYLDFKSQLYCVNAGHGNEAIVDEMVEQLRQVQYVSPSSYNDTRNRLAAEIVDVAPDSLSGVFFSISGSEANETAIQIAREYTGARKVLTRWRSYHGSTYGAGGLTGDPETRNSLEQYAATTGTAKFLPPMVHDSPFSGGTPEEVAEQAADHLEFVIRNEGPDSIAAILTEPIAGSSGAYTGPADYFQRVRELCDEYDILLISDEVITGFGRCGEWFGIQTEGVEPDLLSFAKASTSAYAPLAGVIASRDIEQSIREEGIARGQTFAGHPVSCAAGVGAMSEYRGGMIDTVRELAPYLEERVREVGEDHDVVADVRGRGFLWGLAIADPETGEPFHHPWVDEGDNPVSEVVSEARDRGVIIGSGRPATQVMLAPPFPIGEEEIDRAVAVLSESLDAVFG